LHYGTASFGLDAAPAVFETAVRALAEGNSLRSTGRSVQIDKDTACAWLDRAAQHCRLVMLSLWRQWPVVECHLDELGSCVHTQQRHLATAKQICASYDDAWVWVAVAPVWRRVLAFGVGKRAQASANLLLEWVAQVTDDQVPFFTSDQLPAYRTALLHAYGIWHQPARQGDRGSGVDSIFGSVRE
jgi:IS1 family transposase